MAKEKKTPADTSGLDALNELSRQLKEEAEARKTRLMRRAVPKDRTLANALATLTKVDLEDVAYNVGVSGTSGLKKAELVTKIVPAVREFCGRWFVTLLDEQYQAFKHLLEKDGLSAEFREDEMRMDYFQSLGLVFGAGRAGKLVWYLPDEIRDEFKRLDSGAYAKAVEFNTDVYRIAAGILFYYGVLNYDELFAKVKHYMEGEYDENFDFAAFMGIMMNGCCWQTSLRMMKDYFAYYTVIDAEKVYRQAQEKSVGYAKLSYDRVYDAGEENYIEATDAYKSLAQFFMQEYSVDVLRAANIVGELTILWQNNGGDINAGLEYLATLGKPQNPDAEKKLGAYLIAFHNSLRLWALKGHSTAELVSGKLDPENDNVVSLAARRKKKKVGRNDPCPCGSGKKYKNCCMRKDEE